MRSDGLIMKRLRPTILILAVLLAVPTYADQAFPPTARWLVGFTPGDALPIVLEGVRQARRSIWVACYSFTSKPVAVALLDAAKRGVKVNVLADAKESARGYSAVQFLANQGIPVRLDQRHAMQHNKFMVIDETTVETGSFNYTAAAAQRNAENVLLVRNVPELADSYATEWRRLWDGGTPMPPVY